MISDSTFREVSTKSSFSTSANTDGATGSTLKEDPSKSIFSTAGDTDGVPSFKSGNQIGGDSTSPQETFKNPWLWIGIGVVIIAMTIFGYKRKKRNAKIQRKRGANISTDKDTRDAQEMTPLMLGENGRCFIKVCPHTYSPSRSSPLPLVERYGSSLTISGNRFISPSKMYTVHTVVDFCENAALGHDGIQSTLHFSCSLKFVGNFSYRAMEAPPVGVCYRLINDHTICCSR